MKRMALLETAPSLNVKVSPRQVGRHRGLPD
jgi:hypothetical protein